MTTRETLAARFRQVLDEHEHGAAGVDLVERLVDVAEAELRNAKAEALREAAEHLTVKTVDPAYEGQSNDGEFGSGFYQGIRSCRRALRARADELEGEGR